MVQVDRFVLILQYTYTVSFEYTPIGKFHFTIGPVYSKTSIGHDFSCEVGWTGA